MRDSYGSRPAAPPEPASPAQPVSCPSCRSSAILTAAKSPDAGSYWRCTKCGEVWNAGRRETGTRNRGWR
jgi:predicted Zn finger-like uncharacterized protein